MVKAFCKKCGSILMPQKGRKSVVCKCGYVNKEGATLKEEIKKTSSAIEVVTKEVETLPTTEAECSKCGHKEAYYWTIQTRAADEGETKFLKCKGCNHTWRDYG